MKHKLLTKLFCYSTSAKSSSVLSMFIMWGLGGIFWGFSFGCFSLSAQSADQNYTVTTVPKIAVSNPSSLTDANSLSTIQYFDGLGRPIETVQKVITPNGKDLVNFTEYDAVGREYKHWLSITSINTGAFVPQATFAANGSGLYNSDVNPFAITEYEPSPLNRVTGQYGAGASWYAGKRNDSILYQTNIASEAAIVHYFVNTSNQLTRDLNNYTANNLYKTQTIDEDGKIVIEYKDKLGHVVMKQSSTDAVKTYYVYNDLGQLAYVLPPIAADSLPSTVTIKDDNGVLQRYAYLYKYDESGNNILKRLPGCDTISMVYDKADRLILSQDGNQRVINSHKPYKQWTVIKYDVFGRVLYTATINRDIQSSEKTLIKNSVITENFDGGTGFYNTGYTCTSFSGELKPLMVNYYDSYTFRKLQTQLADTTKLRYATLSGYDAQYTNAKGLLTGTRTYILDNTGNYLANALYYDDKGRIVQCRGSNQLGGYDIVYNHFDFIGKVRRTHKEHILSGQTVGINEGYSFAYDNAERLTKTMYGLNTKDSVLLSRQTYDELGRLQYNYRHNNTDTIAYTYNIRNWTTTIKSGAFKEELFYNTSNLCSSITPCFNGNIAASTWTYNGIKKGYVYTYDQLNRLTLATGYQTSGCYFYAPNNREQFDYDKHGNTVRLWRERDYTCMDFLQMSYSGNQVKSIYDGGTQQNLSNVKEYINNANLSTEFIYDNNGNMTTDLDRKIVSIRYNILNLPDTIQFSSGNQIINRYAADGRKLGTEYFTKLIPVTIPINKDTTWTYSSGLVNQSGTVYIDNKEYSTLNGNPALTALQRIYNAEGYADTITATIPNYKYYRRDHLGNNREVWVANTKKTLQRTQYYPSGLPWASNTGDNPGQQERKYNGKEFVEMHGYDTYDYGARGYYPAMGRFTSLDPMAEKYYSISPYVYCAGNPVNSIDPDGRDWYQSSNGNSVIWQKGSDGMEGYKDIGTSWNQKIDDKTTITWDNNDKAVSMTETVLKPEDFSSQMESDGSGKKDGEDGNCFVESGKMVAKSGAKSEDSPKKGIEDPKKELDYIASQADQGHSTRLHVDRNNDGKGDHWVAVSSVTTDLNTNSVTSVGFFDPATRYPNKGTNNSFTIGQNKSLRGTSSYNTKLRYHVVETRKNKK